MKSTIPILICLFVMNLEVWGQNKSFHPNILWRTTTQLSNRNSPFQVFPANYIETEGLIGAELGGLPLQASFRLNSAHEPGRYQLNSVSASIDVEAWKANIKQKLLKTLTDSLPVDPTALQQHQELLANLEQLRGMRIANLQSELEDRFGGVLPEPDLAQYAQAQNALKSLKTSLEQPLFKQATSTWQAWQGKLGNGFEDRLGVIKDSLFAHNPDQYDQFLHDQAVHEQYKRMQEKKQHAKQLLAEKEKLGKLIEDYKDRKKLEELPMQDWIKQMSPDEAVSLAKQLDGGFLAKVDQVLQRIDELQIGQTSPSYTPASLMGVGVMGIHAQVNMGLPYAAFTAGNILPTNFMSNGIPFVTNWGGDAQPIRAAKVGLGDKKRFFELFGMDMRKQPLRNQIVGAAGALSLFDQKFQLAGDWQYAHLAGAALLRDEQGIPLNWSEPLEIDSSLISTGTAWQLAARANLTSRLIFDGSYHRLTPGYMSLAAPLLNRSTDRYNANLSYSFAQGRLQTTAFMRREEDASLAFKYGRSLATQWGLQAQLRLKANLPSLHMQYIPFSTQQAQDSNRVQRGSLLSGGANYAWRKHQFLFQSQLTVAANLSNQADVGPSLQNLMINLHQQLQVGDHVGGSLSYSRIGAGYNQDFLLTHAFDASLYILLKSKFRADLGATLIEEAGEQGVSRKSIYFLSQIPILPALSLDLRAERNLLNNFALGLAPINEYLLRASCTLNF